MARPLAAVRREVAAWHPAWVAMWAVIAVGLIGLAFTLPFWHWWTAAAVGFGVPEFIGARVQNDRFPPLTHVIVRYVHPELGLPALHYAASSIFAFWSGFPHPGRMGAFAGFLAWLTIHFLPRYTARS